MWARDVLNLIRETEGVFGMTDQPTTCPQCGLRSEIFEEVIESEKPIVQLHLCKNDTCGFIFVVEDDNDEEKTDGH